MTSFLGGDAWTSHTQVVIDQGASYLQELEPLRRLSDLGQAAFVDRFCPVLSRIRT